jgi:hypothetical protein
MVNFLWSISLLLVSMMLSWEICAHRAHASHFHRFGLIHERMFIRREPLWGSGGIVPCRYETADAHWYKQAVTWIRIPDEERYYHQLNGERTSHRHS